MITSIQKIEHCLEYENFSLNGAGIFFRTENRKELSCTI